MRNIIKKLAIAVTFFYVKDRLIYLKKIASQFNDLADNVFVYIITNTKDKKEHQNINDVLKGISYKLIIPNIIGHPYLLTWIHLEIFKNLYSSNPRISHFMYVEDDILIKKENISYWLNAREELKPFNFIPMFMRYEIKNGTFFSTDTKEKINPKKVARLKISKNYSYLNPPWPYQACYLYDRELMHEYLTSDASNPDYMTRWGIRERAASALTFYRVPKGALSRSFLGYNTKKNIIDPDALIHHTPNNYALNPQFSFGKIPVHEIISPKIKLQTSGIEFTPGGHGYEVFEKLKPALPKLLRPFFKRILLLISN